MSKTISFRGIIPVGNEERIRLATLNGKTGYKISKFQTIESTPGGLDSRGVTKVFTKSQSGSINDDIDFTESDMVACAFSKIGNSGSDPADQVFIFDNEVFNQDIYVTVADVGGSTTPMNYYIELETVALSDSQTTQLTLKNLRNIASR